MPQRAKALRRLFVGMEKAKIFANTGKDQPFILIRFSRQHLVVGHYIRAGEQFIDRDHTDVTKLLQFIQQLGILLDRAHQNRAAVKASLGTIPPFILKHFDRFPNGHVNSPHLIKLSQNSGCCSKKVAILLRNTGSSMLRIEFMVAASFSFFAFSCCASLSMR